jgi:hypothetical protein
MFRLKPISPIRVLEKINQFIKETGKKRLDRSDFDKLSLINEIQIKKIDIIEWLELIEYCQTIMPRITIRSRETDTAIDVNFEKNDL